MVMNWQFSVVFSEWSRVISFLLNKSIYSYDVLWSSQEELLYADLVNLLFISVCYICMCVCVRVCFILFMPPSLHLCGLWAGCFLAVALHTGWRCGLPFSDPQHLSAWPSSLCADTPLKRCLPLQAFNTQLLCLLVLQFSPSPSPLQVLFICPVSSPHLSTASSPARF